MPIFLSENRCTAWLLRSCQIYYELQNCYDFFKLGNKLMNKFNTIRNSTKWKFWCRVRIWILKMKINYFQLKTLVHHFFWTLADHMHENWQFLVSGKHPNRSFMFNLVVVISTCLLIKGSIWVVFWIKYVESKNLMKREAGQTG